MRIGIIGLAVVADDERGLERQGHEVRIASRSPQKLAQNFQNAGIPAGTPTDVAAWAEALVLAVKGTAAESALREAGAARIPGKLVIDTTNPIGERAARRRRAEVLHVAERFVDGTAAEKAFPEAKFVKAFNSVGSALMVNPALPGARKGRCSTAGTMRVRRDRWRESSSSSVGAGRHGNRDAARAIEPLCDCGAVQVFAATTGRPTFHMLRC